MTILTRILVLGVAASLFAGTARVAAAAGMKSGQLKSTLTSPSSTPAAFSNTTSKGSFTFKGTKISLKAKHTTLADTDGQHCTSDDIICLVKTRVVTNNGTDITVGILLVGEAAGGSITAAHDLCKDRDATVAADDSIFCPDVFGTLLPISLSDVAATCYAPDPAWMAAHTPSFALPLSGHACEGVIDGSPTLPASAVLFSSGSSLIIP